MESETTEVVDLVHELVLQSRPPAQIEEMVTPSRIGTKSVPSSPVPRSQTFPVRKKVQITSAPLKPPDIGNMSLFPSMEESAVIDASPKRIQPVTISTGRNTTSSGGNLANTPANPFLNDAQNSKLKTLEAKMTEPLGKGSSSIDSPNRSNSTGRRASLNELSTTTPGRKTPRSAKLFSDLSSDRRQKLDELAEKYSNSIDSNHCRSVLDELEFLFQLLNSSSSSSVKSVVSSKDKETPLLSSPAEQAYFVIKVIISQLNKMFLSIPSQILQQIIDNYPHKIPKPVRKHIEDWIVAQEFRKLNTTTINETVPIDLAKTVTFQSEKDGRSNFPHQTDFHAFCKQRDLFYSIRETWTDSGSSGNTNSVGTHRNAITDRSRSRMSFPPANNSSGSRSVDSVAFKVQSLFQMNRSPTNLFHMASLFVSHYILEARAQELGGVPKDDHMKEFFQSNPTKLLQLNSRFSTASAETLENEQSSNLAFQKQFLLSSSVKFLQHIIDRLVVEITQAEAALEIEDLANLSQICRLVKDTVHFARLLGYATSLPYLNEDTRQNSISINSIEKESIQQENVRYRSYQNPPLDLKFYLEKATRSGRLTTTGPWIVEYLLQCDPVTLLLSSYQPILASLLSLYKKRFIVCLPHNSSRLGDSNKNFLRFYFGMLFSSKAFPDSAFSLLKNHNVTYQDDGVNNAHGLVIDTVEEAAQNLTEHFFAETFKRFKRILSWGKLDISHPAITGEFRHIRPIPAPDKSKTTAAVPTLSKERILQTQLEATFFELYSPSVKKTVDYVAERMSANFVSYAKSQLFPNFRTLLASQGIFGVRAAEKCKARLNEEMSKYLCEKCCLAIRMFLEHSVTVGVLGLCQRITIRKAKDTASEWINNYINAGMFPDVGGATENVQSRVRTSIASLQAATIGTPLVKSVPEEPPFEILILVHRTLRKLHSCEKIDLHIIDKILSCQSLGKVSWVYSALVDWGMGLITFQPQALTSNRIKQLITLWKGTWGPSSKIINPRNLMLLTKSENPRDSWIKLGSVTQQLINEGMINAADLEQQCLELLREEWPDEIHKKIFEFLTIVLETFREREEWHSESAQVLDWVAWLCSGQPDQD